eukprot:6623536-Pyramimonas_sp.AAC.1
MRIAAPRGGAYLTQPPSLIDVLQDGANSALDPPLSPCGRPGGAQPARACLSKASVSYTHLRAHETGAYL